MTDLTNRETALFLIALFLGFCWMSNDDLRQAELAQGMAQVKGGAR
jgi:hypothetical protein